MIRGARSAWGVRWDAADRLYPLNTKPWIGALIWAGAWGLLWAIGDSTDLLNLTMVAVMASALSALWLSPLVAFLTSLFCAVVFNYLYVPPRGQFELALDRHHAFLDITVVAVSWIIAWLTSQQRRLALEERVYALRAEQLQGLGDALRDADDPRTCAPQLQAALSVLAGQSVVVCFAPHAPVVADGHNGLWLGEVAAGQRERLLACWRDETPSTQPGGGGGSAWYLPLRGRRANFGAACLPMTQGHQSMALRSHAQALCDQMGVALERHGDFQAAFEARQEVAVQHLRNALLTAISHDYRTPLATILGAASSLKDQADRVTPEQRDRLLSVVVDETVQLTRITNNTLQLARLDSPGVSLHLDWESAEEMVGSVLRRARQRDASRVIEAHVDPGLPLVRCDAVLLAQLLDNLVDNAFRHGGHAHPVEIVARQQDGRLLLAVKDRGPGIAPAWRERVFQLFERAEQPGDATPSAGDGGRRGAGLGLAVCRLIAQVHDGDLFLRERAGGGSSLECWLPLSPAPFLDSRAGALLPEETP